MTEAWIVPATATATARIEVEAATEEEAIEKAKAIGGFGISDIDELLDFEIEETAETSLKVTGVG